MAWGLLAWPYCCSTHQALTGTFLVGHDGPACMLTESQTLPPTTNPFCPQTQVKLRAEANILSRTNDRLKAEKAADAARMAALQQEAATLRQQLAGAGAVADKLRAEIGERDGVISNNYATMQGLRRRVQELETHRFVLTYKVGCVEVCVLGRGAGRWRLRGQLAVAGDGQPVMGCAGQPC